MKGLICRAAVLLSLLGSVVPAAGQPAAEASAVLSPGDSVRITVWRKPELSGAFAVAADGSIAHPLYREVRIVGLPHGEAEGRLREYLSRYEAAPQFVLEPLLRVVVGGEVRQPRVMALPPETTIAQAVALAGGPTERARAKKVRLVRGGEVMTLDLTLPADPLAHARIRSGDQVTVPRRVSVFRDYIAPASSVTGALISLLNFLTR